MFRVVRLLVLLALVSPCLLSAGEKKPPPVTIRLHNQGDEKEGESFVTSIELTNPPQKIFIRKVPIVTERDIKAFLPFPGRDGMIAAYFRLDADGTNKLAQFTNDRKGEIAVLLVNGRVASAARVERGVNDGILYVPGGILPNEIAALELKYPIIGREKEFGKKPKPVKKTPQS